MGKRSRHEEEPSSKKHRKEKKSKRSKNGKHKDCSSRKLHKRHGAGSSSSEGDVPDYVADIRNVPIAAEYVRCILRKWPALKGDLRELLWKIDQGEGVDVSGIAERQLRSALRALFTYLNLLQTSTGMYTLRVGQDKTLRRIGAVLMEQLPDESHRPLRLPGDPEPSAPPHRAAPPPSPPSPPSPRIAQAGTAPDVGTDAAPLIAAVVGPAAPRRVGPAMPSAALMDAAAEAAAAMREEGLLGHIMEGMATGVVGPAPPASWVAEAAALGQEPRAAEVARIISLLEDAARGGARSKPDAYAVLGVDRTAASQDVKKRFWRLSLLIHPDKCDAARAADAFHAVKEAAQTLQDTSARAALDEEHAARQEAAIDRQVLAELEQERQWRILRGEATAEDLRPVEGTAGPSVRDEWMTALPEMAAKRPAYLDQKSVTQFAQQGSAPVQQDSSWIQGPAGAGGPLLLNGSGQRYAAPVRAEDSIAAKNRALMELAEREARQEEQEVLAATSAHPGQSGEPAAAVQPARKSLLEQHQEALKREQSAARKRKKQQLKKQKAEEGQPEHADQWQGEHPWRPFDREKDLVGGPANTKSAFQQLKEGGSSLGSRFRKATS